MSGGFQHGFGNPGLPSLQSLTIHRANSLNIPYSRHHSSEDSENASPSGGPAEYFASGSQNSFPSSAPADLGGQSFGGLQYAEDTPYLPRGFDASTGTQGFILPSSSHRRPRLNTLDEYTDYTTRGITQTTPQGTKHGFEESGPDTSAYTLGNTYATYPPQRPQYPQQPTLHSGHYAAYDDSQWRGSMQEPALQYRHHTYPYPSGNIVLGGHDARGTPSSSHGQPHGSSGSQLRLPVTGERHSPERLPTSMHPSALNNSSAFPDAGPMLRSQLGLDQSAPVDLWSLPDPPPGEKPTHPYPTLIKLAIYGSPRKQLTLQEIYRALIERFEWFRERKNENAWKNSIRHNLSLNKVFRLIPRPITEPGKGSYWLVDMSEGEGYKRPRKRRPKGVKARNELEEEDGDDSDASTMDDSRIDPELRGEGHQVGESRPRSSSRRSSPYLEPLSSTLRDFPTRSRSNSGSASSRDVETSAQAYRGAPPQSTIEPGPTQGLPQFGHPSFGQPSFRQPAFGQPSFGQTPGSHRGSAQSKPTPTNRSAMFMPSAASQLSMTSTALAATVSTACPGDIEERNFLNDKPALRPVVEHVSRHGVLPSARRIDASSHAYSTPSDIQAVPTSLVTSSGDLSLGPGGEYGTSSGESPATASKAKGKRRT